MSLSQLYIGGMGGILSNLMKGIFMCKEQEELVSIIDEIAGAAVSMSQGAQSYDSFIRARDKGLQKINESFGYRARLTAAIEDLHKLV